MEIPASFLSRIFFHSASAFLADQFSIFVEKLRKKRYSFAFDISTKSNFNFPNFFRCCRRRQINSETFFRVVRATIFYRELIQFTKTNFLIESNCTVSRRALLIILNCELHFCVRSTSRKANETFINCTVNTRKTISLPFADALDE